MEAAPTSTSRATHTMPTTTTLLPSHANAETDKIRDVALRAQLRQPREAAVGAAGGHGAARQGGRDPGESCCAGALSYHKPLQRRGLFHEFEYIPSRYALAEELRRHEGAVARAHEDAISAHKFTCAGTGRRRLKFEDQFEDRALRYPYLDDPFGGRAEQERRLKWLRERRSSTARSSRPASAAARARDAPRGLRDAVARVHGALAADWATANFSVMATREDHVVTRFELGTVDSERALRAYMNVFATGHDVPVQFQLRRVVEDWGTERATARVLRVRAAVGHRAADAPVLLAPPRGARARVVAHLGRVRPRDARQGQGAPPARAAGPCGNQPSTPRSHNRRYV